MVTITLYVVNIAKLEGKLNTADEDTSIRKAFPR